MKENSFFRSKAGGMTIAFIIMMIGFAIIMAGINSGSHVVSNTGFIIITAAVVYSPVKVYIIDKIINRKAK